MATPKVTSPDVSIASSEAKTSSSSSGVVVEQHATTVHQIMQSLIDRFARVSCVLLTDKDGVLISRAFRDDAKDRAYATSDQDSLFNVSFAAVSEQASKLQLGDNRSVTSYSDNMCVIHANFSPLVLSFICEPDVNTSLVLASLSALSDSLEFVKQAVIEELSVEGG